MANVTKINLEEALAKARSLLATLPDNSPITPADRLGLLALFYPALQAIQRGFIDDVTRSLSIRKSCALTLEKHDDKYSHPLGQSLTADYYITYGGVTVAHAAARIVLWSPEDVAVHLFSSVAEPKEVVSHDRQDNKVISLEVPDLLRHKPYAPVVTTFRGAQKQPLLNLLTKLKSSPLITTKLPSGDNAFDFNIREPQAYNVFADRPLGRFEMIPDANGVPQRTFVLTGHPPMHHTESSPLLLQGQRDHLAELAAKVFPATISDPKAQLRDIANDFKQLSQRLADLLKEDNTPQNNR
jgi:hypothetical protein